MKDSEVQPAAVETRWWKDGTTRDGYNVRWGFPWIRPWKQTYFVIAKAQIVWRLEIRISFVVCGLM
jgi:hypothetical protein